MVADVSTRLAALISKHEQELLSEWIGAQLSATTLRQDLLSEAELKKESTTFFKLLREAISAHPELDLRNAAYQPVRDFLADVSRSRARRGFTPTETATFVFSLKQPLFSRLQREFAGDPTLARDAMWAATALIDGLGLHTTELHQKAREEVIARQQAELLELSTPVVQLWPGVLALPIIGTLDSKRTQIAMEMLLSRVVETGSQIAILDITGVPTVDTLTAQHLLKTVTATRLMGAECIISGIRPQIAQTIVHLGVDLSGVLTKASMATALDFALRKLGLEVRPRSPAAAAGS